jgi:hypothetical protein
MVKDTAAGDRGSKGQGPVRFSISVLQPPQMLLQSIKDTKAGDEAGPPCNPGKTHAPFSKLGLPTKQKNKPLQHMPDDGRKAEEERKTDDFVMPAFHGPE